MSFFYHYSQFKKKKKGVTSIAMCLLVKQLIATLVLQTLFASLCKHTIMSFNTQINPPCLFFPCLFPVPTTQPPEPSRPELWITVSVLAVVVAASLCGLVLFLHFQRSGCRLKKGADHDVAMLKVPSGEDPTYGVREASLAMLQTDCSTFLRHNSFFPFFLYVASRIYLMSSVRQGVGQDFPTWSRGPWPDKSPLSSVSVSLVPPFLHPTIVSLMGFLLLHIIFLLLLQAKAAMGKCGGGRGWGRALPSRSSPPGTSSPGSGRRRSTTRCSCGMTTYWVHDSE